MAIVNILPEDYPTPRAWRTSIKQRDHVMAALDGPPDSKAADHLMAATDPDDDDPTCDACQGTGDAGPDRDCPMCGGRGWRDDPDNNIDRLLAEADYYAHMEEQS